uniref:Uncharacterized protein n=1 Tax=Arundo donax TaxID=35708 RepID=A0A0A9DI01_ARUDO
MTSGAAVEMMRTGRTLRSPSRLVSQRGSLTRPRCGCSSRACRPRRRRGRSCLGLGWLWRGHLECLFLGCRRSWISMWRSWWPSTWH